MKIFKIFFLQQSSLFTITYVLYNLYAYFYNFYLKIILKNKKLTIHIILKFIKITWYTYQYLKIIYFLIKSPIISPKTRQLCYNFILKTSQLLIKKFCIWTYSSRFYSVTNSSLNQNHYFTKKKILILYKSNLPNLFLLQWVAPVMWYYHFYFNKIYLILLTSKGSYKLQPLAWGLNLKTWFLDYLAYYLYNIQIPVGFYCNLKYLYLNYFYYSLYVNNIFYAQSSGTFLKIIFYDKMKSQLLIKLPSLQILSIANNGYIYMGRNANIFAKKIIKGGYFSNYITPKRIGYSTRGISKNPVDHPNGGRTNVKSPFKTPWGKIAKNNK